MRGLSSVVLLGLCLVGLTGASCTPTTPPVDAGPGTDGGDVNPPADGGQGEVDAGEGEGEGEGELDAGPNCTTANRAATQEELLAAFPDGLFTGLSSGCASCHIGANNQGDFNFRADTKANMITDLSTKIETGRAPVATTLAEFLNIGTTAADATHVASSTAADMDTHRDAALEVIDLVSNGLVETVCTDGGTPIVDAGNAPNDAGGPVDAGIPDAGQGDAGPAGAPTRLDISTPPRSIVRDGCENPGNAVTIVFKDAAGNSVPSGQARTLIFLRENESLIEFFPAAGCAPGTASTTFPAGAAATTVTVFVTGPDPGTFSFTVTSAPLTSVTQSVTVN